MTRYEQRFINKCAKHGVDETTMADPPSLYPRPFPRQLSNRDFIMRDFRGLLKIAGLEKKADPPNAGLNDPNPLKREAYRKAGYIPNVHWWDSNNPAEVNAGNKVHSIADKYAFLIRLRKPDSYYPPQIGNVLYRGFPSYMGPKLLPASLFDLYNSMGLKTPSFRHNFRRTPNSISDFLGYKVDPYSPFVVLGNFPLQIEEVLRHELGHFDDYRYKHKSDPYSMQSDMKDPETLLDSEIRAWDYSGIPEGHPVRESALNTYRAYTGAPIKYLESNKISGAHPKSYIEHARDANEKYYKKRPETYINKYKDSGIPIIWDYHSATNAAHNGIDLSNYIEPDFN